MIIAIILLFSFLLDGILLSCVDMNTVCCPLITLSSLVIIYPFFSEKKKNYFIISGALGFFYDICYSNILFFNVLCFFFSIRHLFFFTRIITSIIKNSNIFMKNYDIFFTCGCDCYYFKFTNSSN